MDLYIIRHAWAGDYGDPQWPTDAARPLTAEGRERFAAMMAQLVKRGMMPTLLGTSPLVRCVQTAELVVAAVGTGKIVKLDVLQPGGDFNALLQWTVQQSKKHLQIGWVGHAPDVEQWATAMIGQSGGWLRFPKGAVAAIRFDGLPTFGGGELRWLVTAKVLGC
jgi:phosphohistidine phosphatase